MKKIFSDPGYLLTLVSILIIISFFGKFIFHANDYLLTDGGDGFKNYYTPAWYVKYDSGTHFTGMNYPYGEHVVFTDNQPIIAGTLNFIDDHLFNISNHTTGILNILLFSSLLFSVILVYKIVKHYGLPPWVAFFSALLIGFGGPQLDRFTGHFALGYTVFIPLLWWLIIRLEKNNFRTPYILLIIFVNVFFAFIHVYYLFTALLFLFSYIFVLLFKKTKSKKQIISLLTILAIPVTAVILFMKLTDHITDRPQSPYGFFDYKATFQSVFLNKNSNLLDWMHQHLLTPVPDAEGRAYVGIMGLAVLILSFIIFIKRWLKKRRFKKALFHLPGDLGTFLLASVLVLLFSMALPFSLGLDFLLDRIPFIKQFRSPGRFAWIFYYVYTVYGAVIIYLLYKIISKHNRLLAALMLFTALFLQGREVVTGLSERAEYAGQTGIKNPFTQKNNFYSDYLQRAGADTEHYQSILFFPSFFQGSEKLYIDRTEGDYKRALEISYQTGIPLVNQMMSRTSLSQTLQLASLPGHPALEKKLPSQFTRQPILLITTNKNLVKGEQYLISKAKLIATDRGLQFYALSPDVFNDQQKLFTDYFTAYKDSLNRYAPYNYYSLDSNFIFYRNSFEDFSSPDPFLGNGSYYFEEKEKTFITDIPVNIQNSIWIEVSYWARSYIETAAYPHFKIEFLDENDQVLKEYSVTAKNSVDILGKWVRGSDNFEVVPEVKKIRVYATTAENINIDELIVRHTAFDVFYDVANDSTFVYNNYPVGIEAGNGEEK